MGSEAAAPVEGEVRAVAELRGRQPDELTAIRVPGPGRVGKSVQTMIEQLPELDGFAPPERLEIKWKGYRDGYRFAARYGSPDRPTPAPRA